ncbi:hypothetical protein J6Z19_05050 [bacterium]|nr:hypothetical protein [bacterium]
MTNLGLKLKVFFLMAVVITALSAANFIVFKGFIEKIDIQDGARNAAELVGDRLKNMNYNLIANSFEIVKQQKIENGRVISRISSEADYAIINQTGAVIDGNVKIMTSYAGIPAVNRALKEGLASDGVFSVENNLYLIGVVPFNAEGKLFAAVSFKKFSNELVSVFPMPVRAFKGDELIAEKGGETWNSVESSYGKQQLDADISAIVKNAGQKELNKWTRIFAFFMPYDVSGGEKITLVAMTSLIPGWESYNKVIFTVICYSFVALLIAVFFTFIVTHEIDNILKNLASDVSRMRVGEKLVLKRYSNGAGIVVSAMNKLIQQYIELNDDVSGITASPLVKPKKEKSFDDFETPISDPFGTEAVHENKVEEVKPQPARVEKTAQKPVSKAEVKQPDISAVTDDDDDDDENEKTQIAPTISEVSASNPFDVLWEDYCRIKRKNGENVSDKEKTAFIGKVRTNKASIMAKYKCSDVWFSVEEKDGKPVVKAKPVN